MIKLSKVRMGTDGQAHVVFDDGVSYSFDPKPVLQQRLIAIPLDRPIKVSLARNHNFLCIESTRIYASVLYNVATYKGV